MRRGNGRRWSVQAAEKKFRSALHISALHMPALHIGASSYLQKCEGNTDSSTGIKMVYGVSGPHPAPRCAIGEP